MSQPTNDGEPITGRVTKAVEEKMGNMEKRSYDKLWAVIQPVATYLICGLIAGSMALWQGLTTHGQEIKELRQAIARLENRNDTIEEIRREVIDLKARRDEFNHWRDATDRRIGDLATIILDRGKQKNADK
jgi:hypothetical protein